MMATRNVVLTPHQEQVIQDLEHGRFTQLNEGHLELYLESLSLEATTLASEKH